MTVNELITILQKLPQDDKVCVQALNSGFSACCSVISEFGVTYVRDHVITRNVEVVSVSGLQYEIVNTTSIRNEKVLSWAAHVRETNTHP